MDVSARSTTSETSSFFEEHERRVSRREKSKQTLYKSVKLNLQNINGDFREIANSLLALEKEMEKSEKLSHALVQFENEDEEPIQHTNKKKKSL